MVGEAVDLDVATDGHIGGGNKVIVLVNVLVLCAAQERSFDDAGVLLSGLVDRNRVVSQVEANDEAAVNVLRDASVEPGGVAEDLLVVVHSLEKVTLRFLRNQVVDVAEGVFLLTEAIVRRNLLLNWRAGSGHLDAAQLKEFAVLAGIEFLSVLVNASDVERSAKRDDRTLGVDFVASEVVVTDEGETRLLHFVGEGNALSPEQEGEAVTAIVGMVHLTDFDGVIGQEVVDHEGKVFALAEETEHFAIVVQELLLGGDTATSKRLFHELLEVVVLWASNLDLRVGKGVSGVALAFGLGAAKVLN